jgi:hypothetical protein
MALVYISMVRKPHGNRPLGRLWYRSKYNIKTDLRETDFEDKTWIGLAQNSV